jgi:cytochrome c-type biogenesis protein CcmE
MKNFRFISLLLLAFALVSISVFQATTSSSSVVKTPSQLNQEKSNVARLRVVGRVAKSNIDYKVQPYIELRFRIFDPGLEEHPDTASVPVIYRGAKPDMFASGRDVIIDGYFSDNIVYASTLLTQCPSKYEPPTPSGGNSSNYPMNY